MPPLPMPGGPLGGLRPAGMPGAGPAPAPPAPSGPATAPATAGGPTAGPQARAATLAGVLMKGCLSAAAQLDPKSPEAKAFVKAYQALAGQFKAASGGLEQSELSALGRAAQGGPGVFNDQQKAAFQKQISQMQPPKAA